MPAIIWELSFLSGRSLMQFWVDWWQLELAWGKKMLIMYSANSQLSYSMRLEWRRERGNLFSCWLGKMWDCGSHPFPGGIEVLWVPGWCCIRERLGVFMCSE